MKPSDTNSKPLMHARLQTPTDQTPVPGPLAATGVPLPSNPAAAGPPGLSATPTVSTLLLALKRRWPLAVGLATVAAALTVGAVALVFPPKYVAQTRLELQSRPTRPMFQGVIEPETDPAIFRASQQAIIKSPLVLSSALNSDKLKGLRITGQSTESLETALKIDFTQGPEVMTIKLSGDQPDHLADLLNAVVQAYVREVEGRDSRRRTQFISQLEESKRDNEKKLTEKRLELAKIEKDQNVPDQRTLDDRKRRAADNVKVTTDELRLVSRELLLKKRDLNEKKAELDKIADKPISPEEIKKGLAAAVAQGTGLARNVKPVLDFQNELDLEIAKWLRQLDSPQRKTALAGLYEQRRLNQANIDAELDKIRSELEKEIRLDRKEKLDQDVAVLGSAVKQLETDQKSLQIEKGKHEIELNALEAGNLKVPVSVQKLRDDENQIMKVLDTLAVQVALLKAEPTMASRIAVLQPAETPSGKDYSRLVKLGGAGGLGVFGLVLFGIAFVEFRARKVNGVDEVTQGLGMNLVGTLPNLPLRARRPASANGTPQDTYWQSIITESVDAIRTQLLHAARTDAVQVVMVTSAGGGEGKTSLASQLAASLARAWRKTLLVDGDLRNPAAHKLFDLPLEPGLSEILRGEVNVTDAVKPTSLSRLWLMSAGHWDAHAVQALAQDGVGTMFEQLKEQYDFIVVDSCPVLPVADSLLLAQHVDGVIFSVLRDVSRMPSVHAAQQKLQALGVRTLGAVVIGATPDVGSLTHSYAAQAGT